MSIPHVTYYFRPGRLMKKGRTNPGLLVVGKIRTFQCNSISKDKSTFSYACNERLTVGIKCKAKAVVVKCEGPDEDFKYEVSKLDTEHTCPMNYPKAIADEMRHEMKEIVRKEPHLPVLDAISNVRKSFAEKFDADDETFDHIIAELGADKPLERQLLRVRKEIIGNTPINRDRFDQEYFLRRIYGMENGGVVMDSNKLDNSWREKLSQTNPNTNYRWENIDDNILQYEDNGEELEHVAEVLDDVIEENHDGQSDNVDQPLYIDMTGKDLPKRVLAYSSIKLLKLFSKHLKSSVDGTFKSACTHWGQSFIWMLKVNGHWVPAVHAWLPDKTEESYKVFLLLVKEKLEELSIPLNISAVISDFEMAILKSIDEMLAVPIEGCFFHFSKALKSKVDKNHFKTRYEGDLKFQQFIKECGALAHCPSSKSPKEVCF